MVYTRADHDQIVQALGRVKDAVDGAAATLAGGDVDKAAADNEHARDLNSATAHLFPPAVVAGGHDPLPFTEIYPDLYDIDLLLIVTFQWPDASPTAMTDRKELIDAYAEKLANLRQLRDRPWAPGRETGLAALDDLITKAEALRVALAALAPDDRVDPRKYTWLGQDFKVAFLNAVGAGGEVGTMYSFLFLLDYALDRARWSLAHGKKPGAARRFIEANRVQGLFLDWLREHEPPA